MWFCWLMCSHLVSNTVRPCNPLSVYHACYCFLMDKKKITSHEHLKLKAPVNFNNKCFYQKMYSEWQAKGTCTCITNLKIFYVTCIFQSTTDTKVDNIRQHSLCILQVAGAQRIFFKRAEFFKIPHTSKRSFWQPPPPPPPSLAKESKI